MLEVLGDFVLGDKSPIGSRFQRVQMGNNWTKPNFSPLMGTITTMMTDKEMIKQFPLSDNSKKILESKHILSLLMSSENNFTSMLNSMCVNNYQLTKKMAKVYVKNFNRMGGDQLDSSLRELQTFMLIDDKLKKTRFEWVFGIAAINVMRQQNTHIYGVMNVQNIEDHSYEHKTILFGEKTNDWSLMRQTLHYKERGNEANACRMVLEMMNMACLDDEIASWMYNTIPSNYQYAHYTDYFGKFIVEHKQHLDS